MKAGFLKNMREDNLFLELSTKICCTECLGPLNYFPIKKRTGIFLCRRCHNINLVDNNIFFFLPRKYDSIIYYEKFRKKYLSYIKKIPKNTYKYFLKKIISLPIKPVISWEDEDTVFWNKRYKSQMGEINANQIKKQVKIAGIRAITRERSLFRYLRETNFENKFVLEIGCGESMTINTLFSPLYYNYNLIATDYSYWALRYSQKQFGNSNNTFYFLCLGHLLPFKAKTLDYVLCLGVLHHMPKKEAHLPAIINKLKSFGYFISTEAYDRKAPEFRPALSLIGKFIEPEKSIHEERVNWQKARQILKISGTILKEIHEYSPARTILVRLFSDVFDKSRLAVDLCILLDKLVINTIGKIWRIFGSGSVLFIFQKK